MFSIPRSPMSNTDGMPGSTTATMSSETSASLASPKPSASADQPLAKATELDVGTNTTLL